MILEQVESILLFKDSVMKIKKNSLNSSKNLIHILRGFHLELRQPFYEAHMEKNKQDNFSHTFTLELDLSLEMQT